MNFRKFYLMLTCILAVFLFLSGTGMLVYIGSLDASEVLAADEDSEISSPGIFDTFIPDNKPVNFLLLVGDKWGTNTDTMMLVNVNPQTDKVNAMSIPRDTKVVLAGNEVVKINSLYAKKNGQKLLIDTVSTMFNVKINYYAYFNISTVKEIINLLGGVEFDVPVDLNYFDPTQDLLIDLKKGKQILDGDKAEQLLRFRGLPHGEKYSKELLKYYDGSDTKRILMQQRFLKELVRQKANVGNIGKISSIIETVFDNLETNIRLSEVLDLLKNAKSVSINSVQFHTLPTEGSYIDGISYVICDMQKAEPILKQFFNAKAGTVDYSNVNEGKKNNTNNGSYNSNKQDSSKNGKNSGGNTSTPTPTPIPTPLTNPSNDESNMKGPQTPAP